MSLQQLCIGIVLCLLGFTLGWLGRGLLTSPVAVEIVPAEQFIEMPQTQPEQRAVSIDAFAAALTRVKAKMAAGRYAAAYDLLLSAANLASSQVQEEDYVRLLAQLVDDYTKELVELRQAQGIDDLYERITFDYPQYAEYQFKLGKIRLQMGNLQAALPPLSQVMNHPQFGAEARELMGRIENNQSGLALTELPLQGSNGQFIVEAAIDGGQKVNLLVDTGAAMTAIDRGVLQSAGYDLNTEQQYFATANGVVAAPVLTLRELRLGDARVANLSVGALPLNLPGKVVGLLGMNFLRHYEFRIDQTRQVLVLDQR